MVNALDIAAYFSSKIDDEMGEGITNLKMQKLVFYAQAYHLAIFNKPLFDEDVLAWQHGPVIRSLYDRFKSFGARPVAISADEIASLGVEDNELCEFLDGIYEEFGQYSAWRLRDMTHSEEPWMEAFENSCTDVISQESMMDFYRSQLVADK